MAKKKSKSGYNDHVDAEKLTDNSEPRTSLQDTGSGAPSAEQKSGRLISPPTTSRSPKKAKQKHGKRPPLTHFLCLPLVNESSESQLLASLQKFKNEVAEMAEQDGKLYVPEKAIRPLGTLHLTLGVMSLDEEKMGEVGRIMESLDLSKILEKSSPSNAPNSEPLTVALKSLHAMQKPASTSILYAEPKDESGRLYQVALKIRDVFAEQGVMIKDDRKLKLHATVVNTVYARGAAREKPGGITEKEDEKGEEQGAGKEGDEDHTAEEASEIGSVTADDDVGGVHEVPTNEGTDINTALETAEDVGMTGQPGALLPQAQSPNTSSSAKSKSKRHRKTILKLDSRPLLAKYADFVWAENIRIEKVQVCKMGAKNILSETGDVVGCAYEGVFEKGF